MWRRYSAVIVFFVRSASRYVLKNIAQTTHFIEKRLFHRQGRLSPKNRESAFVYAPRGLSISRFTTRENEKSDSLSKTSRKLLRSERADEAKVFPSLSGAPRFFRTEKTPQRKNGAATRTGENSHDRTIFLVSPALSRSAPQTARNISTNLCPTRSQEVR